MHPKERYAEMINTALAKGESIQRFIDEGCDINYTNYVSTLSIFNKYL